MNSQADFIDVDAQVEKRVCDGCCDRSVRYTHQIYFCLLWIFFCTVLCCAVLTIIPYLSWKVCFHLLQLVIERSRQTLNPSQIGLWRRQDIVVVESKVHLIAKLLQMDEIL